VYWFKDSFSENTITALRHFLLLINEHESVYIFLLLQNNGLILIKEKPKQNIFIPGLQVAPTEQYYLT